MTGSVWIDLQMSLADVEAESADWRATPHTYRG